MSIIYHDVWRFSQNATIGTRITSINATDKDTGINAQIKFTIISGNDDGMFELNETSGDLLTLKELDYDQEPNLYKVGNYLKLQLYHFSDPHTSHSRPRIISILSKLFVICWEKVFLNTRYEYLILIFFHPIDSHGWTM